jgi:4'-phosphopantetheinyl transferase
MKSAPEPGAGLALPIPPLGSVDVWVATDGPLSEDERRACEALLDDAERTRLRRFLVEHARSQFLAAHALVRTTLSRYGGKAPEAWEFTTNAYGRPYLKDGQTASPLHFSLSHTRGLIACAVSGADEVGVDVELANKKLDCLGVAQSAFAGPEFDRLSSAEGDERRELFFSYWTLKEAYVKARGMGLSLPLTAFWFDLDGAAPTISFSPEIADTPHRWSFRQFAPTGSHRMALAASFGPHPLALQVRLRDTDVVDP